MQKAKLKMRFLVLALSFGFLIFDFGLTHNSYALDLGKIRADVSGGDYESAIKEGEKILGSLSRDEYSRNNDELYYLLGLSYLKQGNYLRASDIFEIIIREFKDSNFKEDARLALADTYFLRGDYSEAQGRYKKLLDTGADTKLKAAIYYRLSQCAAKEGNSESAKGYLDKLKQEFPLSFETVINPDTTTLDFYYSVQIGSFSSQANARNLTEALLAKGYPAYLEETTSEDKPVYRVRAGKFRLRQEAIDLGNKLSGDGYPTKICP